MIHDAEDRAYVLGVIARRTKGGATNWTQAADDLGMELDELRQAYDLDIPQADPNAWVDCQIPGLYPVRNHPAGAPLKRRIIEILSEMSAAITTIAGRTGARAESVRVRMNQLARDGLTIHDSCFPRTWALTDDGRHVATLLRQASTCHGSPCATGRGT